MTDSNADREFVHSRVIAAPPERVFRALAEPQRLARWWGPAGFSSTFETCDFRPGGDWRFVLHGPDGKGYPNQNVFREVTPQRVVVEHIDASHHFLLTITLTPQGGKTLVGWHQLFDDAEHKRMLEAFVPAANEQNLDRLAAEVRSMSFPAEGGCDCRAIRYRMETAPLVVHCCHCRWCQRETGASFALNAVIESDRVTNLGEAPEVVHTPSESGRGQQIARCPRCRVAVWSHYSGAGPFTKLVRVGTLDQPDLLPPDVHIFTASKQPWVVLPPGARTFEVFYVREEVWPADSLARRAVLEPAIEAWRASQQQR